MTPQDGEALTNYRIPVYRRDPEQVVAKMTLLAAKLARATRFVGEVAGNESLPQEVRTEASSVLALLKDDS